MRGKKAEELFLDGSGRTERLVVSVRVGRKVSSSKGLLLNVDQSSVVTGGKRVARAQT